MPMCCLFSARKTDRYFPDESRFLAQRGPCCTAVAGSTSLMESGADRVLKISKLAAKGHRVQGSVTSSEDIDRFSNETEKQPQVDILVNNAASSPPALQPKRNRSVHRHSTRRCSDVFDFQNVCKAIWRKAGLQSFNIGSVASARTLSLVVSQRRNEACVTVITRRAAKELGPQNSRETPFTLRNRHLWRSCHGLLRQVANATKA